ncbi:hypothetical protein FB451DRAFT_1189747 [Mycena latifolia]|nr:hypothetical protein FB451DRAFT_1189747 [Mycena latifolia]
MDIPSLSFPPLPPLPGPQTLELDVPFLQRYIPWFIHTLTRGLTPSFYPALTDLTVTLLLIVLPAPRGPLTAQQLAAALAAHPAIPRIWWLFKFPEQEGPAHIADLVDEVQRWMPTAHARVHLVVEM